MRRIMAMGDDFACMMQDDDLICWGRNTNLILGETLPEDNQRMCIRRGVAALSGTRPIVVASNLPPGTEAVAHRGRVCYRRPDERVFCWGKLLDMENVETWSFCEDADEIERAREYPEGRNCVATPTELDLPDDVEGRLKQFTLGGYDDLFIHECMLKRFSVYCRGDNFTGSMGLGHDVGDSYHPDWQEVTGINSFADYLGSGAAHSCIIERFLPTSLVSCWGMNTYGQVGVERIAHAACEGWPCEPTSRPLNAPNDAPGEPGFGRAPSTTETVALSVGYNHNCSVNLNGQVLCWGLNSHGQTGQPVETEMCNIPGEAGEGPSCTTTPTLVEGIPPMVDVSVGESHSCALSQSGQIWCWGDGGIGNLGTGVARDENGEPYQSASPVRIGLLPTMKHIATRGTTTCAISLAGDMYCWGDNAYGQCAIGDCGTYELQPIISPFVTP